MKKFKIVKKLFLFFMLLCVISIFIVILRQKYFENKERGIINNIENMLEDVKKEELEVNEEKEKPLVQDGAIGIVTIASIGIKAPIYEGTSLDVLKYAVRSFRKY